MAPEPRNDTVNTHQLIHTELQAEENVSSPNTTDITDITWDYDFWRLIISIVTMIICLCGMVGNGIVIWLLGFRMKRNHFSVYILNLAIADFTYLLSMILVITNWFIYYVMYLNIFVHILYLFYYSVGISLLMAISVERCISVLWPIWYKCHRPTHISIIACALIWVLSLILSLLLNIFYYIKIESVLTIVIIYLLISIPTFLVLLMSSLILFIRVQCYSQQRKTSRLYWTILFNILVFMLLGVPNGVYLACNFFMGYALYFSGVCIITTLSTLNSTVNPIIYFFIGRHRQQGGRKPLQEVLQRALMDENEETGQRREEEE